MVIESECEWLLVGLSRGNAQNLTTWQSRNVETELPGLMWKVFFVLVC